MKNKNGLTRQQQGFADYHRSHPDVPVYEAYQKFYKSKSLASAKAGASRLLTNVNLVNYLGLKQQQIEEKIDIRHEYWVSKLVQVLEIGLCERDYMEKDMLVIDGKLQEVELRKRTLNLAAANKAIELIGKYKKWLTDGAQTGGVAINTQQAITFVAAKMD